MPKQWIGSWDGGRTRRAKDGSTIWVLEKMIHGRRYNRTLEAGNEREALRELALFERDPDRYAPRSEARAKAVSEVVQLSPRLVERFLEHLRLAGRSEGYRKDVRQYLSLWAEKLAEKDLRTIALSDLKIALASWATAKKYRIVALKSFFSFLRDEGMLTAAQDASLALKVPPPRPEKAVRDKGYEVKLVEKLYAQMGSQSVRDVLCLHAKCGMHGAEIARLARGEGEARKVEGHGEIAGTLTFRHKSGRVHVQSVDAQALAAALRLQSRGAVPRRSTVREAIAYASKRIGQTAINPGELRHSFVTWAASHGAEVKPTQGGVALTAIAAAIGHQSTRTTKFYYDGTKVPPMVKVPIRLEHPEDPLVLHGKVQDGGAKGSSPG